MKLHITYNSVGEAIKALQSFHEYVNPLSAQNIVVDINIPNPVEKSYAEARTVLANSGYGKNMHENMIIAAKVHTNKIESIKYVRNKYAMNLSDAKEFVEAILDADNFTE